MIPNTMAAKFLRASNGVSLTHLESMTLRMEGVTPIGETAPGRPLWDRFRRILLTAFAPGGIFAWYRLVFEN